MQNQCLFFPYRKVRFFRLHYERVKYKFWIKSIMDPIWTPYQCDISKIIMYQNFSLKKRAWNISRAIFDGLLQTQLGLDDFLIMKPLLVCQTSQIIMKLRHPPPFNEQCDLTVVYLVTLYQDPFAFYIKLTEQVPIKE